MAVTMDILMKSLIYPLIGSFISITDTDTAHSCMCHNQMLHWLLQIPLIPEVQY